MSSCPFTRFYCIFFITPIENFSLAAGDYHSPSSIPISPSPRTLTGCPVPTVPPAGQSVPHVQTPLSDPRRPQPPSQVARESQQSAKAPSGTKSGGRRADNVDSSVPALGSDKKHKKQGLASSRENTLDKSKNSRRKATNGWRPFGLSYQKEVFTVVRDEVLFL